MVVTKASRLGTVVMLTTAPGVFSTHFLNKFTQHIVSSGRRCIYFCSDTVPWIFVDKHNRVDGGGFINFLESGKLTVLNLYNARYGNYSVAKHLGRASTHVIPTDPRYPIGVLSEFKKARENHESVGGVFESVPSFVTLAGSNDSLNFFRALILSNKLHNDVFIYKIQKGVLDRRFEAFFENISDIVVELRRDKAGNSMILRKGYGYSSPHSVEYSIVKGELVMKETPDWASWMWGSIDDRTSAEVLQQ